MLLDTGELKDLVFSINPIILSTRAPTEVFFRYLIMLHARMISKNLRLINQFLIILIVNFYIIVNKDSMMFYAKFLCFGFLFH